MIQLMVIASAVIGLSPPAPEVTGANESRYAAWLYGITLGLDKQLGDPHCDKIAVTSLGRSGLKWSQQVSVAPFVLQQGMFPFRPTLQVPNYVTHEQRAVIEHLKLESCGRVREPNILTTRVWNPRTGRDTDSWQALEVADGRSSADPRLQVDLLRTIVPALANLARSEHPACTLAEMTTTYRLGSVEVVTERDASGTWTELWPATLCGSRYAARVTFTRALGTPVPGGSGTSFQVKLESRGSGSTAPTT